MLPPLESYRLANRVWLVLAPIGLLVLAFSKYAGPVSITLYLFAAVCAWVCIRQYCEQESFDFGETHIEPGTLSFALLPFGGMALMAFALLLTLQGIGLMR